MVTIPLNLEQLHFKMPINYKVSTRPLNVKSDDSIRPKSSIIEEVCNSKPFILFDVVRFFLRKLNEIHLHFEGFSERLFTEHTII